MCNDCVPRENDAVFVVAVQQGQIIVSGIRRDVFRHLVRRRGRGRRLGLSTLGVRVRNMFRHLDRL